MYLTIQAQLDLNHKKAYQVPRYLLHTIIFPHLFRLQSFLEMILPFDLPLSSAHAVFLGPDPHILFLDCVFIPPIVDWL
ncbi:hypothetical protein DYBT9623_04510 [Dyadobacter sp. CECT 9623]|uniref:Uncharacterized protein n=1 Tax=Dyadobacter linearis TaxID=2823330 RepID=A0ABN7RDP1_9BACT|nr:hypothetical protein DYBT9623_04510 [Dyadobacter sp. CECT 9623]